MSKQLQVTGFATIAGSAKLSDEVKNQILAAKDGKVPVVVAKLVDAEGNEVTLRGKLTLSSKGSLTSRIALKVPFELVYEEPKAAKDASAASSVDSLAKLLLG